MTVKWDTERMTPVPDEEFDTAIAAVLKAYGDDVNPILNIGITGTRRFERIPQRTKFTGIVARIAHGYPGIVAIHHGCCTGADEMAHIIGRRIHGCQIFGYPGEDALGNSPHRMREHDGFTALYDPAPYSKRNLRIVTACTMLIACPLRPEDDPRSLRSGTWQTVRYARRMHKPTLYVMSDGQLYL